MVKCGYLFFKLHTIYKDSRLLSSAHESRSTSVWVNFIKLSAVASHHAKAICYVFIKGWSQNKECYTESAFLYGLSLYFNPFQMPYE
jgi:hypothetical protein